MPTASIATSPARGRTFFSQKAFYPCQSLCIRGSDAERLLSALRLLERKDQKVQGFSKGMKQRLMLAMALLHEPSFPFLDEPIGGLDLQSRHLITGMLREEKKKGTTIFLRNHTMEEAHDLCDRVAIMREAQARILERLIACRVTMKTLIAGDMCLLPLCSADCSGPDPESEHWSVSFRSIQ